MIVKFYQDPDRRWYADLPEFIAEGGSKEACEMICGADTWLNYLSQGNHIVKLEISTSPLTEKLVKYHEDYEGATYVAEEYLGVPLMHQLWLCPVTLFVFEKYPDIIYYQVVKS